VGAPSAWSGSRPGALEPRRSSTTHLSKRAEACGGRAGDLASDLKVMTRLAWLLVDVLSRALTPDEREDVRGDLEEAGGTGVGAAREVLGLVLRRQAATWMDCRPWVAVVTIVLPVGVALTHLYAFWAGGTAIYSWLYIDNWTWGYLPVFSFAFYRAIAPVLLGMVLIVLTAWWGAHQGSHSSAARVRTVILAIGMGLLTARTSLVSRWRCS